MVDFNSDGALGTNRGHILDLVLLGRHDEWLNTYQKYVLSKLENSSDQNRLLNTLKAISQTIEFQLRETLKRRVKTNYEEFKELIKRNDEKSIIESFNIINRTLDELQITKIDTRKNIDFTNIEEVNRSKGM